MEHDARRMNYDVKEKRRENQIERCENIKNQSAARRAIDYPLHCPFSNYLTSCRRNGQTNMLYNGAVGNVCVCKKLSRFGRRGAFILLQELWISVIMTQTHQQKHKTIIHLRITQLYS
jgi:hypothetical protein